MPRGLNRLLAVTLATWLAGCAPIEELAPPDGGEATHIVYVISNGWHTGIAMARRDLPAGRVPESADFPGASFLEFGWGDRDYYTAARPTVGMALAAALTPSPAVMRVAGLVHAPPRGYREGQVLAVALSAAALDRMVAHIDAAFERPAAGERAKAIAGDDGSRFYPALGRFHLFNTCNTWTARMLAAAGLPLSPSGVITADELMDRLRPLPAVTVPGGQSETATFRFLDPAREKRRLPSSALPLALHGRGQRAASPRRCRRLLAALRGGGRACGR